MSRIQEAYRALGLKVPASREEIDRAYHRRARRYPPEIHPERFAAIHEAYRLLSSLESRMAAAADDPEAALDELFPWPAVTIRPLDASWDPTLEDFEPLLGAWRRDLLKRLLRWRPQE